jgi:hypothetical protein
MPDSPLETSAAQSDDIPPGIMADPVPERAAAPMPRRSGWGGPVLGGVIAAGLGFGLAQVMPWAGSTPMGASVEEMAAAQAEIAQLRAQIAAMPVVDLGAVTGRLVALEAQISDLEIPDLSAALGRIAALEARPAGGLSGADAAALAGLQTEVAAMKTGGISQAQVDAAGAALQAKLDAALAAAGAMQASAAEAAAKSAQGAALLQIRAAMDSGAAFGAALAMLEGVSVPEALSIQAGGLPSLKSLQDAYPQAARLALDAALKADMGEGWTERALSYLRTQVGARSLTAREGADPDAILSRAEAALSAGDVPGALTELDALPDIAKTALSAWRADADRRQAAQAALMALTQELGL